MDAKAPYWKGHAFAVWVTGGAAVIVMILTWLYPPDPSNPMGPKFLSSLGRYATWLRRAEIPTVGLFGFAIGLLIAKRKPRPAVSAQEEPLAIEQIFELEGTSLDARVTDPLKGIYNTAKLRLFLTNRTAENVHVYPPKWLMKADEISVQCGASPYPGLAYEQKPLDFGYFYQLEQYQGSWKDEKWKKKPDGRDDELKTIIVPAGFAFRIWIALNPCVPHSELENRKKTRRLGTLILPVEVNGQHQEISIQL